MKENFNHYLGSKIDSLFAEKSALNDAIRYSLLAPGKRIRPLLCIGFSQGFNGQVEMAQACGMAVEMIHTYSLIHDDLPAMDNDDYRRGQLTNHKVFGEATAILAGDSLLTCAPEFLMRELSGMGIDSTKILELTTLLLKASGPDGMVKGQALDMKYESEDLGEVDQETLGSLLRNIHKLKTGAIITWSALAGLYTHPDSELIKKNKCQVESLGQRIGLLFQIIDDILDVTSNAQELGKTPGKDQKSGKFTFVTLYGLGAAAEIARELIEEIKVDLETYQRQGGHWEILINIIESLQQKLPA